jgi:hypothetical protein
MHRLGSLYKTAATVLVNLLILFIVVNLLAALGLGLREYVKHLLGGASPVFAKYSASLAKAYPNRSLGEVNDLLAVTWNRPLVYAPFVQFHEGPAKSRFVNVTASGMRLGGKDQPWPPAADRYNIFVFGGSTTFGYGLADDETIPAALGRMVAKQEGRQVEVYNLGQAYYGSTQERIYFQQLLLDGVKPDLAIFVDGLNDSILDKEPLMTSRLREALAQSLGDRARLFLDALPITRVLAWLEGLAAPGKPSPGDATPAGPNAAELATRYARYWRNQEMIAAVADAAKIPVAFVWQPAAPYATDTETNPFYTRPGPNDALEVAFAALKPQFAARPAPSRLIWCADLPRGQHDPLYVDAAHYSAKMSELMAGCIKDGLAAGGLLR